MLIFLYWMLVMLTEVLRLQIFFFYIFLLILIAKNATANELQYLSNKLRKQTEIFVSYHRHQNCLDKSLFI